MGEVAIELGACRQQGGAIRGARKPLSVVATGAWLRCLGAAAASGGILFRALDWDDRAWRKHIGIPFRLAETLMLCGYLRPIDGTSDVRVLTGTAARYL